MEKPSDSFALILFGITSNLAKIKLIPALYDLEASNLLPSNMTVLGVARSSKSKAEIEDYVREILTLKNRHHDHEINPEIQERLVARIHYIDGHLDDSDIYVRLTNKLDELRSLGAACDNRMFYFATYPDLYQPILENIKLHKLTENRGWIRIMIEKPIGSDLASAQNVNKILGNYFSEEQIFRLDHYLGKETMQNILAFRFANGLFEPLMNKDFIDHIQVTAAEDFGIGERGEYFDTVGSLKDVGQNHLLQMLTFALMEKPDSWNNTDITARRIEFLNLITPDTKQICLGQYNGYRQSPKINPESQTDTFFAFKAAINNERFQGVPVYFRGGKELAQTVTEVSIVFKPSQDRITTNLTHSTNPNVLIYRIQPNEGIVLRLLTKKQQHELELEHTYMQFCYKDYSANSPDPYERLIMDAFRGDQTFFVDAPEVEAQWKITDQISALGINPTPYEVGTWGPETAHQIIEVDRRTWLKPSLQFCNL